MRTNTVLTFLAIILAAFILPGAVVKTQPVAETIYVDTLTYLAKNGGGEAGGALFLPDGNIITLWKGRPLIVDSKSGEIIRNLDALPSGFAAYPKITRDGTKLVTKITGPKLAVWDIPTGKLIFQLDKQISYFCLSPGGTKLYVTLPQKDNNPGIIVIYDMNTFQEIERLPFTDLTGAYHIDISPDGQTLAVVVNKYIDSQTSYIQIILINLNDKKNYSLVESSDDGFMSIQFSPDGQRIASLYNNGNHIYIYI